MFWDNSIIITSAIKIAGGLALMLGSMTKKSTAASWAKKTLALAGLLAFCGGLLFMIKIYYGQQVTPNTIKYINHYKTLIDGIAVGLLIALFCSGELNFKKWQNKKGQT